MKNKKSSYVTNNTVDVETLEMISHVIWAAEYCKNSYFWCNNGNSSAREDREKRFNTGTVNWCEGGDEYSAAFHFRQSRCHTYAYGEYYRNGQRTTLTAIRNSYNRLIK